MEDGTATAAVKSALDAGYRHIDCAPIYLNEADIGIALSDALSSGSVQRDDLWITSKLWPNRHRPDLVQPALRQTLSDLRLDYLDLFMIHWPLVFSPDCVRPTVPEEFISLDEVPLSTTWAAMEECLDLGLCRNLGVCNFSIKKLQGILANCQVPPAANQVESHPFFPQQPLFDFCQQHHIQPVAFSPLGSGDRPERMRNEEDPNLHADPTIQSIAEARNLTTSQIMLAWAVTRGTVALPKSSTRQHQLENLAAGSLVLDDDEMIRIDALKLRHRYVHGRFWKMEGTSYSLESLWDETDVDT